MPVTGNVFFSLLPSHKTTSFSVHTAAAAAYMKSCTPPTSQRGHQLLKLSVCSGKSDHCSLASKLVKASHHSSLAEVFSS